MTSRDTTLVIKDVPADICGTCGEAFVGEVVTQRPLTLAGDAAVAGVEVQVRRYIAA